MSIDAKDIVPIGQVRARFSELASEARAGARKVITKNGEAYVAVIDARLLDHFHALEQDRIHRALLNDGLRGLDDMRAGRTEDARSAVAALQAELE